MGATTGLRRSCASCRAAGLLAKVKYWTSRPERLAKRFDDDRLLRFSHSRKDRQGNGGVFCKGCIRKVVRLQAVFFFIIPKLVRRVGTRTRLDARLIQRSHYGIAPLTS